VKNSAQVSSAEKATPARRSFSIDEFCERNGISRRLAYNEIGAGRLKIRKAGRRSIVTTEAEDAWLAALPTPTAA
jgi:hypothetical protein